MTAPSDALVNDLAAVDGDILVLGAAGKMGPTLCKLAQRGLDALDRKNRVIAVSRFSTPETRSELEAAGVSTIACDLLDNAALATLPRVENVIYMVGTKFGTSGAPHLTWRNNVYVSGQIGDLYRDSRIVVFSSGNVYPLRTIAEGGADERMAPGPVGEYAQSVLGRERMFDYAASRWGTRILQYRLNYAIDLRYGVLHEVARAVWEGRSVDVSMGLVNVIWQGDANAMALRGLLHASNPPRILNVTGPETVSLRWLAQEFSSRFGKPATLVGEEAPTALISNAAASHALFGYPGTSLGQMIEMTTQWVRDGGERWDKPTHFQERQGQY